jgi:hypothetical protein
MEEFVLPPPPPPSTNASSSSSSSYFLSSSVLRRRKPPTFQVTETLFPSLSSNTNNTTNNTTTNTTNNTDYKSMLEKKCVEENQEGYNIPEGWCRLYRGSKGELIQEPEQVKTEEDTPLSMQGVIDLFDKREEELMEVWGEHVLENLHLHNIGTAEEEEEANEEYEKMTRVAEEGGEEMLEG